jgi:hypothetical protein
MDSTASQEFWRLFEQLPQNIQKQAREAFVQFKQDAFGSGLNLELVNKKQQLWSVRVTGGYRAIGRRNNDKIRWIWIGKHDEYEFMIRHLK